MTSAGTHLCRTCVVLIWPPQNQRRGIWGLSMMRRTLSVWAVLALVGVLSGILIGHLWDRYSQETAALGFSGIYERYLASQAGFGDDVGAYRAMSHAGMSQEASALEE
jgi:hypothetical protein